jgi:hypothetical protein
VNASRFMTQEPESPPWPRTVIASRFMTHKPGHGEWVCHVSWLKNLAMVCECVTFHDSRTSLWIVSASRFMTQDLGHGSWLRHVSWLIYLATDRDSQSRLMTQEPRYGLWLRHVSWLKHLATILDCVTFHDSRTSLRFWTVSRFMTQEPRYRPHNLYHSNIHVGSIIVETQEWYLNASVERSSTQLSGCYPLSIFLRYGTCHNPKPNKTRCLILQEEIKSNIDIMTSTML